ncbi:hypothetical protein [Edaphobacter bradus]|uniref:hypothetical protein n=1 Tax=Edaphobacter bradus TaxID=2259016 RepID=UPI0021DF850A|nr:hypothetical protein [Edaphobacter bradus]
MLYVTECALREAPEEATEQQIGINVFQRLPGYNSSEDSIVRTHARLLRQRLGAYFAGEGATEEMVIEIPKGHYLPVFRSSNIASGPSQADTASDAPASAMDPVSPSTPPSIHKSKKLITISFALIAIALLVWRAWPKQPTPHSEMEQLWHPFLSDDPPLVIYSNALFVGNSNSGLRLASPDEEQAHPSGVQFVESYTGVGEVVAIHELTQLFDAHHSTFILKRSRLVTWDEAKLKNLIFVGSPAQNPASKVVPSSSDFTIVSNADSAGIVNLHPQKGEPALYSRPDHPLTKDYAILTLAPGAEHGKWTFGFSGLTTFGTQAAVEYASRPESVAELVHAASLANGKIHPFEAVLEITISSGVPLQTKLVSVHLH